MSRKNESSPSSAPLVADTQEEIAQHVIETKRVARKNKLGRPRKSAKKYEEPGRRSWLTHLRRVNSVEKEMITAQSTREIIVKFVSKYGVVEATVYGWINEVRERWRADARDDAPTLRQAELARLKRLQVKFEKEKEYKALVQVERLYIDVAGLKTADVIEHRGQVLHAHVDLSKMTEAQLEAYNIATEAIESLQPSPYVDASSEPSAEEDSPAAGSPDR